jgi:hypothetical protein
VSDLEAIADRVEIEALRGELPDAATMRDYDRLASLFTRDGGLRIPHVPVELAGGEAIRAWGKRVPSWMTSCRPPTRARSGSTMASAFVGSRDPCPDSNCVRVP